MTEITIKHEKMTKIPLEQKKFGQMTLKLKIKKN